MSGLIRIEKDFIGEKSIPADAYYGIQTMRAVENFPITGVPIEKELITALAAVKKAAAAANMDMKMLPQPIGNAIITAAEEVMTGQHLDHFIVDSIQGGAGTSINMNMNEVLANRSLELLEQDKGDYFHCNPNNHVNMSQSTNDAIPTALRIAAYRLSEQLLATMKQLAEGFKRKEKEFDDVVKVGRTHLQDAVPIKLGQEFGAYARVLSRDIERLEYAAKRLLSINLGATAVGTGLNAKVEYIEKVSSHLSQITGLPLYTAEDLVDATQNTDSYLELSAALKVCAVNMSKICNDIRLMASGPRAGFSELLLPPRQPGSSIMPGKVNPVMAEVMNQISFQVIGNDHTIALACEAGQFELNVMGPVIAFNLLQSLKILNNGMNAFHDFLVKDLDANRKRIKEVLDQSFSMITALNPHLGYDVAAGVIKEALRTGSTITAIILERGLLTMEELDEILHPEQMTTPGIAGERFLHMN
ncbi:aspartate ammonia-lyase [Neobacillus mesonae]|nr:aspartate ammonia-lyase [Neobacillus mesonae]